MKKAKMMLLGVAIFGTVGAALAFKAKEFSRPNLFICTTTAGTTIGTCELTSYNSVTGTPTTFPASLAWTATTTTTCNTAKPSSTNCGTANPTQIFQNQ